LSYRNISREELLMFIKYHTSAMINDILKQENCENQVVNFRERTRKN